MGEQTGEMFVMRVYVTNPPFILVLRQDGTEAVITQAGACASEAYRYAWLMRRLPRQETDYGDSRQLFVYDEEG